MIDTTTPMQERIIELIVEEQLRLADEIRGTVEHAFISGKISAYCKTLALLEQALGVAESSIKRRHHPKSRRRHSRLPISKAPTAAC